ncbi:hypothetical protein G3I59_04460 [Amycolatopsis rubida]|uniref:Secreted protein n=1 Tax=Amycolatopsis rubida TaxID=112413 RepID=A0ABX0BI47_9PSEU|nr:MULTISPECIES: hypothetical protein [Amycolatopsis]MYW89893.1 hypothetical protein [Amycolatopsis rubida]NEC54870.1 hypothetical protein [Amycolatopsis rubida]OAP25140.1 hypothetical protein A4R44_04211 [Amycolatopsis sp. M39]
MTTAAAASAPRHRSILVVALAALLLLGVAVPGPGPAGPRPHDPEPALVQEQGPHLVAAHPLPLADAPGEIRLARPGWCTVPFSAAPPVELDRAPAPAAARAPPDR